MKKFVISLLVMAVLAAAVVSGSVRSLANGCTSAEDSSAPVPCFSGGPPPSDDDDGEDGED